MMAYLRNGSRAIFFMVMLGFSTGLYAQGGDQLIQKVREKLSLVRDYRAEAVLRTDISFMKIPESGVTVWYKSPDKFRIKKADGISVVPKGGISINLNSLFSSSDYTTVQAGSSSIGSIPVSIVKLIPLSDKSDIVLSTLYIDADALIRKASVTTKANGTYDMEFTYGKYSRWGLPDKAMFVFSTKEYKLPKGVTFEYETDDARKKPAQGDSTGRVIISYNTYVINKGVDDATFK